MCQRWQLSKHNQSINQSRSLYPAHRAYVGLLPSFYCHKMSSDILGAILLEQLAFGWTRPAVLWALVTTRVIMDRSVWTADIDYCDYQPHIGATSLQKELQFFCLCSLQLITPLHWKAEQDYSCVLEGKKKWVLKLPFMLLRFISALSLNSDRTRFWFVATSVYVTD